MATWFLHERRTPAGRSPLVCLVIWPGWETAAADVYVIDPGTLLHQPRVLSTYFEMWDTLITEGDFIAGLADPSDPTRFTLSVRDGDKSPIVYDARLCDDDTVTLDRRTPTVTGKPSTTPTTDPLLPRP